MEPKLLDLPSVLYFLILTQNNRLIEQIQKLKSVESEVIFFVINVGTTQLLLFLLPKLQICIIIKVKKVITQLATDPWIQRLL